MKLLPGITIQPLYVQRYSNPLMKDLIFYLDLFIGFIGKDERFRMRSSVDLNGFSHFLVEETPEHDTKIPIKTEGDFYIRDHEHIWEGKMGEESKETKPSSDLIFHMNSPEAVERLEKAFQDLGVSVERGAENSLSYHVDVSLINRAEQKDAPKFGTPPSIPETHGALFPFLVVPYWNYNGQYPIPPGSPEDEWLETEPPYSLHLGESYWIRTTWEDPEDKRKAPSKWLAYVEFELEDIVRDDSMRKATFVDDTPASIRKIVPREKLVFRTLSDLTTKVFDDIHWKTYLDLFYDWKENQNLSDKAEYYLENYDTILEGPFYHFFQQISMSPKYRGLVLFGKKDTLFFFRDPELRVKEKENILLILESVAYEDDDPLSMAYMLVHSDQTKERDSFINYIKNLRSYRPRTESYPWDILG